MAHPKEVHDEIRRLRREERLSYKAIAKRMNIPLSTVVWWCRRGDDAQAMTSDQLRQRLRETQPVRVASIRRTYAIRRAKEVADFVEEWKGRLADAAFVAPLTLYLAEGRSKGATEISNMSHEVIVFVRMWLRREFGVTDQTESFSIQLNRDATVTAEEARRVWATRLGVEVERVAVAYKTPPTSKRKRRKSRPDYAGCCRYSITGFRLGAIKLKALARHMMICCPVV